MSGENRRRSCLGRAPAVAVSILALAAATAGCMSVPNRLNHLHSDADQKLMDTAVTGFKAVTDDAGVYAQRRTNLKAETDFRRALTDKWIVNTDERNVGDAYSHTWKDLVETQLLTAVGLPPADTQNPSQDFDKRLNDLVVNIPDVRAKLLDIADTLSALGDAEAVIQAELLKEVKAAQKAVAALVGPKPPADDASKPEQSALLQAFLTAYQRFRQALNEAGKQYADTLFKQDDAVLARATQLQRDLLRAAASSRDPEAVYAIVAAVGAGLDPASIKALDDYRKHLTDALAALEKDPAFDTMKKKLETPSTGRESGASKDRRPTAMARARNQQRERQKRSGKADVEAATVGQPPTPREEFFRLIDGLRTPRTKSTGGALEAATPLASPADVRLRIDALKLASSDGTKNLTDVFAALRDLRGAGRPPKNLPAPEPQPTSSRPAGTEAAPTTSTAATTTATANPAAATSDPDLVTALVNATLLNSDLVKTLGAPLGQGFASSDLGALAKGANDIVSDIYKEAQGHEERVAQFLADVLTVGADLHGENKRHYDALRAVLGRELERWELLAHSADTLQRHYGSGASYAAVFGSGDDAAKQKALTEKGLPVFILDNDRPEDLVGVTLPNRNVAHPRVRKDDRVYDSVRVVAAAGKAWQEVDPSQQLAPGPGARQAYFSNDRMRKMVELLSSPLYMLSTNERFALEDGVALRWEVGEHDVALDQVEARAREAKLRYNLTELQAYHASGVTTADIQALLQFIQTGLIGWIGGSVQ